MQIIQLLKTTIHPKVQDALLSEYGSLKEAHAHFEKRFKEYAPKIMAEKSPSYLDPIMIKQLDKKEHLSFFNEYMESPWSITQPRPGSMTELLVKHGILIPDKDEFKLDLVEVKKQAS